MLVFLLPGALIGGGVADSPARLRMSSLNYDVNNGLGSDQSQRVTAFMSFFNKITNQLNLISALHYFLASIQSSTTKREIFT